MKKALAVVFTVLLAVTLAFAQTGGGSTDSKTGAGGSSKKPGDGSTVKSKSKSKSHKGGKKGGTKTSSARPKTRTGAPPEPDGKAPTTSVSK